jgi:CheY-like chemotaxis protein
MDGFELYSEIREKDPKVKICFLTANAIFTEEFRKTQLAFSKAIGKKRFIQKANQN